jgi:hypothetical protein
MEPTRRQGRSQVRVGHVVDERHATREVADPFQVDVEADDVEADVDGAQRDGKSDIALTHDHNPPCDRHLSAFEF